MWQVSSYKIKYIVFYAFYNIVNVKLCYAKHILYIEYL